MQDFAKQRTRAASPHGDRMPSLREVAAANAKVPVNRTTLSRQDQLPHQGIKRQPGGGRRYAPANQQQQPPQQPPPPPPALHQDQPVRKRVAYDTDAGSSLDTTIDQGLTVQVEDSQKTADPRYHDDDGEGSESSGDEEGSNDGQEGVYEDEEGPDLVTDHAGDGDQGRHGPTGTDPNKTNAEIIKGYGLQNAPYKDQQQALAAHGRILPPPQTVLDGDNSYPPTTSGGVEEFPDDHDQSIQEASSEGNYDRGTVSPSPQRFATQRTHQHQPAPQANNHAMQPRGLFGKAADLRKPQPANINPGARDEFTGHINGGAPPINQYKAQSRAKSGLINAPTHASAQAYAPVQGDSQLPYASQLNTTKPSAAVQQSVPHPVQPQAPAFFQPPAPAPPQRQAPAPPQRQAPASPQRQAPPHLHKQDSIGKDQRAEADDTPSDIVDYDPPVLFKKQYEELRNEGFDTVPRGVSFEPFEDLVDKPLEERLVLVQKTLGHADQGKFFSLLPTAEWEEAGDWFLKQFGSIIQRTTEARQKKRKLAKDFENEIEKRHKQVAKRQALVEDAMGKMKVQGGSLLPKSPKRASKSPRKG
ncbi:extracellular mutant protein 11-domain-containing protein [Massariosphaeria phaeospora]|uniref:Extracellular mutant protein 11-domain-containing protein n=1 Tax=Massariosphaeria phaeospora TaxID=100035 RepID=A0A7C8IHV5_9PLEO|nr:extracellular mutant protein 11-domain-containing protein [Massariosphaeria phaeospora]